jgi:PRTRC genetic system ThiF family protein
MTYHVDPCAGTEPGPPTDTTIVLVGCGGTGAYLAEAIGRLLIGRRGALHVVDMDRVEPHNVGRQAFEPAEVGRFKAEVLARRLAHRFRRVTGYSVLPYDGDLHAELFGQAGAGLRLIVGCVDNAAARRAIAATLDQPRWQADPSASASRVWWLDAGNGINSGQVLLGNATRPDGLRRAFDADAGVCRALPAPSLQRPDLLDAPPPAAPRLDCAEAVAVAAQGPTINQVVAAVAAAFVEKLLAGTCGWMAAYVDLDEGVLRCLPADPRTAAADAGLRPSSVLTGRRAA